MMQEFVQAMINAMKAEIRTMHTAIPGKIVSFDPSKGLATVLPTMKFKKPDGTTINYPQVTGVPVVIPQGLGQNATIAFPVCADDSCLLIIAEQAIDYWLYGQETDTDLAFDLTNAMCIPGMFPKANAVMKDACAQNAVIVDVKGTRLTVKQGLIKMDAVKVQINGEVEVNGNMTNNGNVTVNGEVTSTGDMTAGTISQMTHTHTCPDGTTSAPT